VGVPLLLQFSIALFTGMVAATLVPPVRRSIPKAAEVCLWIALVTVCLLGVMSITDPSARELSASAAWGAEQVINSLTGLALGGVGAWILENRFALASWLVIIAGADILLLMFIGSLQEARPWQPRVWLREWMEMPLRATSAPAQAKPATDPIAELNRKFAAALAAAGAMLRARTGRAVTRYRQVRLSSEAGRLARVADVRSAGSRAHLDALQEATSHVGYAARAWYAAAGEPAVSSLVARLRPARLKPGQVLDIQALLSAQSIGWYGPMTAGHTPPPGEQDAAEQQSDRLAS
jgi:hypothetical protein